MSGVLTSAAGRSAVIAGILGLVLSLAGVVMATVMTVVLQSAGLLIPLTLVFAFVGIGIGAGIGVRAGARQGFDDPLRELALPAGIAASVPTALTWIGTEVAVGALLLIMVMFVVAGLAISYGAAKRAERATL